MGNLGGTSKHVGNKLASDHCGASPFGRFRRRLLKEVVRGLLGPSSAWHSKGVLALFSEIIPPQPLPMSPKAVPVVIEHCRSPRSSIGHRS
ncbi:MAG: hypothetical protein BGP09_02805 [Rhizobium sp. 60-20]|jgi:hypothetical protein|nr:MAG: hypothetical protein BGP09_02805 [Rhizobium sp. 60-20]